MPCILVCLCDSLNNGGQVSARRAPGAWPAPPAPSHIQVWIHHRSQRADNRLRCLRKPAGHVGGWGRETEGDDRLARARMDVCCVFLKGVAAVRAAGAVTAAACGPLPAPPRTSAAEGRPGYAPRLLQSAQAPACRCLAARVGMRQPSGTLPQPPAPLHRAQSRLPLRPRTR